VDETAAAKRDPDVRGASTHRFEEHQVAGFHVIQADCLTSLVLIAYFARDRGAMLCEYVLHKAAAVEA
jgi:hypothetical protein